MRRIVLLFFIQFSLSSYSQSDSTIHRHFGAMQFGGQTMVSLNHEYSIVSKKHFLLNTNFGLGLNEHADDTDPTDRPVYGIHSGLLFIAGINPVYIEIGAMPATYFYKSTTFVNLNGWFGMRFTPKRMEVFFISIGYTPILYKTYTNPGNHYSEYSIGLRAGVNF